jgi:tripartite ATP-independent transporter DctP family solute receptor
MGKNLSFFIGGLMVGLFLTTGGFAWYLSKGGAPDKSGVRVLKMGHTLDPSHPVHEAMVFMKDRLEEISGGKMTVEIYPSGVLGSETECVEQLQNGSLALTKTSTAPLEGFVEEMQVFGLPYVFRDETHFWQVLDGPIGQELLEKPSSRKLLGLCYYDSGSRNFYSNRKGIRTPDDLKGMKIRVQNSPVAIRMIEVFGGSATPIAFGELYTALAQGTVDGAENNVPSFVTSRHFEVSKHFTLNAHTRVPDIVLMSTSIWESLSPQEQKWLHQAAEESSVFQRKLWAETTAEDLKKVRETGVEVIEPDIDAFVKKASAIYADFKGTSVEKLLERIREVK